MNTSSTGESENTTPTYRKKLIEVALPLEAINKASAREKSIRHGHPSTLHLWWARRPLAACRAVLFAQLVDDPSSDPNYLRDDGSIDEEAAATKRAELFNLIEDLVVWENSNNPQVINRARAEIARCVASRKIESGELAKDEIIFGKDKGKPHPAGPISGAGVTAWEIAIRRAEPEVVDSFLAEYAPPVLDPFCGGGSIPLEAQRLGLRAHASDLNPVPVLITKALIEIPPRFANKPPIHPDAETKMGWSGASGLAEDVRYYGKWMRDEAEKRIGHLYPKVKITQAMIDDGRPDLEPYKDQELTVIAWLWARTVACPNPGCGCRMPMLRSFWLSKKNGKEAFADPVIDSQQGTVTFKICFDGSPPEETSNRTMARCLFCGNRIKKPQLREIAREHGMQEIPLAIVAEGTRGRIYLEADNTAFPDCEPPHAPEISQLITDDKRWFSPPQYGLPTFRHLFTPRQLTALVTFSDLVSEARERVLADANNAATLPDDNRPLAEGGTGPNAYADAVATYLAFALDKSANYWSTLCGWHSGRDIIMSTFGRQALPMVWDFAEANPFSGSSGNYLSGVRSAANSLTNSYLGCTASVNQLNATMDNAYSCEIISTDPPYYDNIGYADLSDFFYVWLRRSIGNIYPQLFSTLLTPKSQELIASPYRHEGSKQKAAVFFETGLGSAIGQWRHHGNHDYPTTIFYAFKQAETDAGGTASTGWETFLTGVIEHGFAITGTWPMRTELTGNLKKNVAALASSVVLVCVPRESDAPLATRREFADALRRELPTTIHTLQTGNIAPVDLAQASIGPGMAVFSRYSKVINADGSAMTVREALQLINMVLDEALSEQEADYDSWTRWAVKWFEQYGTNEGPYGEAETLSTAMAVSVKGVVEAGIARSQSGQVQLLSRDELDPTWDPTTDNRLTIWEVTHYLVKSLEDDGEPAAAELLKKVGPNLGETARELAYRLYQISERKKWAREALGYNGLVASWTEIERLSRQAESTPQQKQSELFG